jgi:hypothetical protein
MCYLEKENREEAIQIGYCVAIEFISRSGNTERFTFDLVQDDKADIENGYLGISTPLGQTLIGARCGETIPYFNPEYKAIKILAIRKSNRVPGIEKTKSRKDSLQKTLRQIEYREAILFASSTDTKWGSYDADGLDYETWASGDGRTDEEQ